MPRSGALGDLTAGLGGMGRFQTCSFSWEGMDRREKAYSFVAQWCPFFFFWLRVPL